MDDGAASRKAPFVIGDLPIGRVMDEALALTKRHGWHAAAVGVAPWVPVMIAYLVARQIAWQADWIQSPIAMRIVDWTWSALSGGLLLAPLMAGAFYIFATAYLGRPVPISEGFRHAARCWPAVAPIYVLLYAMVSAGYNFMCFLPGIALVTALYLHLVVMALEGAGPIAAVGRGFTLMRGRVTVIFLVVLAHSLIDGAILTFAFSLGPPLMYAIALPILRAPVSVFFCAVVVVMYVSARSRHEAIDLQLLADDIAAEAGEMAPIRL